MMLFAPHLPGAGLTLCILTVLRAIELLTIILLSQMRKLRHGNIKNLPPGPTAKDRAGFQPDVPMTPL